MRPMSTQGATVVPIRDEEAGPSSIMKKPLTLLSHITSLLRKIGIEDHRKLTHSIKVGIALVLVSLLYLLQPLYERVGDNAMWAIMTVIVVFEFTAGGTISKCLNRGMGTILGGGLGCLAALSAHEASSVGRAIAISICVFIFGAAATYSRLIPSIKKKVDYGAMIFILTFNLVAVSGFRGDDIIKLACERLSTIFMGIIISAFISLIIFPIWAGDELHLSLVSKFDKLALTIEECMKEYFRKIEEQSETQTSTNFNYYKSVLHSKAADEALANFARWEPWHGKFGFSYPWNKYLCIGELLGEFAALVLTLRECLQSHQQSPPFLKLVAKEPCEAMGTQISSLLRELGDDILNMRKFRRRESVVAKLHSTKLQLHYAMSSFGLERLANENCNVSNGYPIASFVFMLIEMIHRVEVLAKEVEELGDLAGFRFS
ncbi:aluminum-activated malate transporter 12-like protein [Cinnamomum micranthum f. kanehirae]|uniref:Aluminum-activated malate transporter 12-like protein n=1 Tax=Cinnamomum micranthum f. kanehirae TaxID=337451 RepID=A0A3S3NUL8_9MAGN|nr:aluminum-activated malate transporter 12-like protein [Cinnamomum micranthum f. kanehirae]